MKILHKIIKYSTVGVLGTLLHMGLLVLFVECLSIDPVLASGMGFIVTLVVSYYLNSKWTFHSKSFEWRAFLRYTSVSLTGLGLNLLLMYLTTVLLQMYYLYGQITVIAVIPTFNFILNHYWAFPQQSAVQKE